MEANKIIIFLKNLWRDSIMPLVRTQNEKSDRNAERIVSAIQEKKNATDISINNPDDISFPIVDELQKTTQAIKEIVLPEMPAQIDTRQELKDIKDTFKEEIKKLDREVIVKNDMGQLLSLFKSNKDKGDIIKELRKLGENIPKNTDYSDILGKIEQKIEKTDNSEIEKILKQLATAEDISVLASWLAVVAEKEYPEFPDFPRDKNGVPLFTPTKVGGGGGGGLTQIESEKLQTLATEAKQDDIIENIKATNEFVIPIFDQQIIDETDPNSIIVTYKKDSVTVATKTIDIVGSVTTITVT